MAQNDNFLAIIVDGETLDYWKNNAEEDYITTPISVLRYINCLEKHITDAVKPLTDHKLPKVGDMCVFSDNPITNILHTPRLIFGRLIEIDTYTYPETASNKAIPLYVNGFDDKGRYQYCISIHAFNHVTGELK